MEDVDDQVVELIRPVLGLHPYLLVEVKPGEADHDKVTMRVRCGGGLDSTSKIVATLLTLIEEMTGVDCDDYADRIEQALQGREKGTEPE